MQVTVIEYVDDQYTTGDLSHDNPDDAIGLAYPKFDGGWRFFPDANDYHHSDISRNFVHVRATITPAIPNVDVFFRSFDVDDPSQSTAIDPNGTLGQDNRGALTSRVDLFTLVDVYPNEWPTSSGGSGFAGVLRPIAGQWNPAPGNIQSVKTNAKGVADVQLATSFAPGDNFRVVAATNRRAVAILFANNQDGLGVPIKGNVPNFPGKVTEQLSVWRHLYIEQDKMATTIGDKATGLLMGTTAPAMGQVVVTTNINIASVDEYKGGILRVDGVNYDIVSNTSGANSTVTVTSSAVIPNNGQALTIYQDDWKHSGNDEPVTRKNTQDDSFLYDFMQESRGARTIASPTHTFSHNCMNWTTSTTPSQASHI